MNEVSKLGCQAPRKLTGGPSDSSKIVKTNKKYGDGTYIALSYIAGYASKGARILMNISESVGREND